MLGGRKKKDSNEGLWTGMDASTRSTRRDNVEKGAEKEKTFGTLGDSASGTPWNVEAG